MGNEAIRLCDEAHVYCIICVRSTAVRTHVNKTTAFMIAVSLAENTISKAMSHPMKGVVL